MKLPIIKIAIIFVCLLILGWVIIYNSPPPSWTEASTSQILTIFIPLLILFTTLVEFFIGYLPKSFILAMGFWLMVIFQALNVLTPILVIAILALSILLSRLYPKHKLSLKTKIPKLKLSIEPKKSTLTRLERRKRP